MGDAVRQSRGLEIGLLYGLIGKVRAMIFLKEMVREGWIKAGFQLCALQVATGTGARGATAGGANDIIRWR